MVTEAKHYYPKKETNVAENGKVLTAIEKLQEIVQAGLVRMEEIKADVVALREALIGLRDKKAEQQPAEPPPA